MPLEIIELKAEKGIKKKRPLLFVHGSFCCAAIWRYRFMPYFASLGHDCYAVSLSGHGQSGSSWSLHFYGLADYMEDVKNAVAQIDGDPVLIGHSLGGMVVQKYMEKHTPPAAVLMNSVPPSGTNGSAMHMLNTAPDLYWALSQAILFSSPEVVQFDQLRRLLITQDTHPASLADAHGFFQPESLRAIMDIALWDIPRRPSVTTTPTFVIGGDVDVMIPTSSLQETADFYKADLHIVKDGPHALMLDKCWQDVADTIEDWINRKAP
ncbi:alpha/beta hydrolase [Terasakiella pusilla]|uniref:alpha/beta hydrolase n=1 Tax=Terasakiella pusilla TaxID=64973 RepID=UPI003AA8E0BB